MFELNGYAAIVNVFYGYNEFFNRIEHGNNQNFSGYKLSKANFLIDQ